jgi:hypothetical protein
VLSKEKGHLLLRRAFDSEDAEEYTESRRTHEGMGGGKKSLSESEDAEESRHEHRGAPELADNSEAEEYSYIGGLGFCCFVSLFVCCSKTTIEKVVVGGLGQKVLLRLASVRCRQKQC